MSIFLEHFGLREQPFGVTPNPRFIYQSPGHREALASLIYAIESNAGFAALIGRAGLGKTTLIFHLLEYFRQSSRTAVVFNTQCGKTELLRYILAELGETRIADNDVVMLYEHFRDILARETKRGRRVIILIDEAQNLALETLESVRLLNNFETAESKLLHIVLVGQPQLAKNLMHPTMEQLLQRITVICRLAKFEDTESIERYLAHRLKTAGYDRPAPLFSADAVAAILQQSDGVPRKINRLCFNAMSLACALSLTTIDSEVIAEVSRDLDLGELVPEELPPALKVVNAPRLEATNLASAPVSKPRPVQSAPTPVSPAKVANIARGHATGGSVERAPRMVAPPQQPPAPPRHSEREQIASSKPMANVAARPDLAARIPSPTAVAGAPSSIAAVQTVQPTNSNNVTATPIAARSRTEVRGTISAPSVPYVQPGSVLKIPLVTALSFAFLAGGFWYVKPTPPLKIQLRPFTGASQSVEHPQPPVLNSGLSSEAVFNISPKHSRTAQDQATGNPGMTMPNALPTRIMPPYPANAEAQKIEGKVVLRALVGSDGRVSSVQALEGPKILADAAINTVQRWVYEPSKEDGTSDITEKKLVFDFRLHSPSENAVTK